MRIHLIIFTVLVLFAISGTCLADDKADCQNNCGYDKRSKDMYCPPAGGYTDDESKQCLERINAAYKECIKACSPPPPPPPEPSNPVPEPPPAQPEEPADAGNQDKIEN